MTSPRKGRARSLRYYLDKILTGSRPEPKYRSVPVPSLAMAFCSRLELAHANYPTLLMKDNELAAKKPILRLLEIKRQYMEIFLPIHTVRRLIA